MLRKGTSVKDRISEVISAPTMFRFKEGGQFKLGEMGEAGPEAVMPLRGPSGGDGVQSFKADGTAGKTEVFAAGWLDDATGTYSGRPVDVAVTKDGALIFGGITAPTVFTHGTADPFGTIDELREKADAESQMALASCEAARARINELKNDRGWFAKFQAGDIAAQTEWKNLQAAAAAGLS